MKLEKYEDKSKKKGKVILISLGVVILVSISFLLYKTFANFSEEVEFQVMKGQVDYFGNSDVYFAFYKNEEKLDSMPSKGNSENLAFDHGECDNGAIVEWDKKKWAPIVLNLSKSKTKCSLYFKEQEYTKLSNIDIPIALNGDGLYEVEHSVSEISTDWNKTEYRYAGLNPDNYVLFNNEKWRIIGLVNVKTENGIEQRIKIIRTDEIGNQKNFGKYSLDYKQNTGSSIGIWGSNDWTDSHLKNLLNGIYYESTAGDCYDGGGRKQCNYDGNGNLPKGLDETARNMIDKEVIWNLGGTNDMETLNTIQFYNIERGTKVYTEVSRQTEWSIATDVGEKHNGIALMYPSDYGYATNGGTMGRDKCLENVLFNWNNASECSENDWLKPSSNYSYTITQNALYSDLVCYVESNGRIHSVLSVATTRGVWPTLYLKTSVKITDNPQSNKDYGTIDNPFILSLD